MALWKPTPAPFAAHKKAVLEKAAKVTDFVHQIGEYPALRQPSKPVPLTEITGGDMHAKIEYLKDCLRRYRRLTGYGRGISAVQVGIPQRFAVVFTPDMEILTIINPKITNRSSSHYRYPEICMSANPIIAPVKRPAWVEFTYYDEDGQRHTWKTKDDTPEGRMMNRVFQHEIDHMEGIINIDKVESPSDLIMESDPSYYDTATFEECL